MKETFPKLINVRWALGIAVDPEAPRNPAPIDLLNDLQSFLTGAIENARQYYDGASSKPSRSQSVYFQFANLIMHLPLALTKRDAQASPLA